MQSSDGCVVQSWWTRFGCFHPDHFLTSSIFPGTFLNLFKLWFPRLVNSSQLAVCALTLKANCSCDDVRADASAGRLKLLSLGVTPGSFQSQREFCRQGCRLSKVTAGWRFHLIGTWGVGSPRIPDYNQGSPGLWAMQRTPPSAAQPATPWLLASGTTGLITFLKHQWLRLFVLCLFLP